MRLPRLPCLVDPCCTKCLPLFLRIPSNSALAFSGKKPSFRKALIQCLHEPSHWRRPHRSRFAGDPSLATPGWSVVPSRCEVHCSRRPAGQVASARCTSSAPPPGLGGFLRKRWKQMEKAVMVHKRLVVSWQVAYSGITAGDEICDLLAPWTVCHRGGTT